MKFGIFFSFQLPRPWAEGDEFRLVQEALEQVELADALGIEHCWAQEHDFLEEYSHSSAPEVFLGAVTQRTKRIRVGHGIVHMPPAFNHPFRVAERIATLDLLSGGRVEWGTGEAGTRLELEAFGVPYVEKRAQWAAATREAARMMCMEPYPGCASEQLNLPVRNVVPKPVQKPHPPLWVACTNRAGLRHAARNGAGALTFAFMDAQEARFWVEEYYETFERECDPIGRSVNPNVAMLSQFMCQKSEQRALELGLEGARFFAFGLAHYFREGVHVPGRTDLWKEFRARPPFAMAGNLGLGSPEQIAEHFASFERAGVDQLILLHQAASYPHEAICESMQLFAAEVLPKFQARDTLAQVAKQQRIAASIERAVARIPPTPAGEPPAVPCYGTVARTLGAASDQLHQDRTPLPAALWKINVGVPRRRT